MNIITALLGAKEVSIDKKKVDILAVAEVEDAYKEFEAKGAKFDNIQDMKKLLLLIQKALIAFIGKEEAEAFFDEYGHSLQAIELATPFFEDVTAKLKG